MVLFDTIGRMKKEEILEFSKLVRIDITNDESEKYSSEFSDIMKMIDRINEVKISEGVVRDFRLKNVMREDEVDFDSRVKEKVVSEFPEKDEKGYLKVQKIL